MLTPPASASPDPLPAWLAPLSRLAGDRRTAALLQATVAGILGSGSLVCRQIAAFPPSVGRLTSCRPPDPAHAQR